MSENTTEQRSALEEAAFHKLNKSVGTGRIVRVVGPVVDVKFDDQVPGIYSALRVDGDTPMGHVDTVLEVESQLEGGVVRTVAMSSTDGLTRGLLVHDTGHPMMMPVMNMSSANIRIHPQHQDRRANHPQRSGPSRCLFRPPHPRHRRGRHCHRPRRPKRPWHLTP